ncbi:MAG: hypothetical protein IKU40_10150 [Clostridia bacterium]|nr:hypothetical protein [Clostridia bacterium]
MKKSLSMLLALLMLLPTFTACAESGTNEETTASASSDVAPEVAEEVVPEEPEITRQTMPDNLPEGLDFEGIDINIIHVNSDKHKRELYVEEDTGDALDSAIYARNLAVEERLNIKIAPIAGEPHTAAQTAVTAGIDDYQVVGGQQYQLMKQATQGLYFNLNEMKYIETEQPWWAQNFIEAATIGNERLYYLTGDATMTMLMNMGVIYVNNSIFENMYGPVDDLYQIVLEGGWNYDVMQKYIEGTYIDANGDTTRDVNDIYGFAAHTISMMDYLVGGADFRFCDYDDEGYPYLIINTERAVSFAEELQRLMYENSGTYILEGSVAGEQTGIAKFSEDTLMFLPFRAETSEQLRDMESDYAILPCPKFGEDQENYSTAVHDSATVLCIPITNVERLDATCAFLEAFAAESYRTVTDVYFGTLLKEKFARDENVATIFDIILEGVYFDFACLHSYALNSIGQIFRSTTSDRGATFASFYQKNAKVYDKTMQKLVAAYKGE